MPLQPHNYPSPLPVLPVPHGETPDILCKDYTSDESRPHNISGM